MGAWDVEARGSCWRVGILARGQFWLGKRASMWIGLGEGRAGTWVVLASGAFWLVGQAGSWVGLARGSCWRVGWGGNWVVLAYEIGWRVGRSNTRVELSRGFGLGRMSGW